MSIDEAKAKEIISKQNEQFLAQKELIEQQLEFAIIQEKALQASINKLTNETNVNNKKAVVGKPVGNPAVVVKPAPAKVNKPDALNDAREIFGINAFNKNMDEKYNKKK
jgi:hypothetical protein